MDFPVYFKSSDSTTGLDTKYLQGRKEMLIEFYRRKPPRLGLEAVTLFLYLCIEDLAEAISALSSSTISCKHKQYLLARQTNVSHKIDIEILRSWKLISIVRSHAPKSFLKICKTRCPKKLDCVAVSKDQEFS